MDSQDTPRVIRGTRARDQAQQTQAGVLLQLYVWEINKPKMFLRLTPKQCNLNIFNSQISKMKYKGKQT